MKCASNSLRMHFGAWTIAALTISVVGCVDAEPTRDRVECQRRMRVAYNALQRCAERLVRESRGDQFVTLDKLTNDDLAKVGADADADAMHCTLCIGGWQSYEVATAAQLRARAWTEPKAMIIHTSECLHYDGAHFLMSDGSIFSMPAEKSKYVEWLKAFNSGEPITESDLEALSLAR